MSDPETQEAPPPKERFTFRQRFFVEVTTAEGELIFEAEYPCTYHGMSRDGVIALEQTLVDLLSAQLELGRLAARLHS